MTNINWNSGQLIEMGQGDTATCAGALNDGQIYALFFYNAAQNQASTTVNVVMNNTTQPVAVQVPGTTQNQGLAALCFVSGSDTNTIAASVTQGQPGAKVQAFLGSVKMPTNTAGISNRQLPTDGHVYSFNRFTRYYTVPQSHWYSGQISSNVNQFISVQFSETKAQVNIVNAIAGAKVIHTIGETAKSQVEINSVEHETTAWNFQGDGGQIVWINADSIQDSEHASISVQSLAGVMAAAEMASSGAC